MARTAQVQPFSALSTTIERRFYLRIVPLAPICISIIDANQCLVINVSENGVLLSTRTGLPCNSVARIALPLDGLPKPVVVNIRVLWTSEIRRLGGIQILDLSDHDRQQIRRWGRNANRINFASSSLSQRPTEQASRSLHALGGCLSTIPQLHPLGYQPALIDGKPVETQAGVLVQLHASPPRSVLR
jgi:hypothetical protein